MSLHHLILSIPESLGSFGHHRWFRNQFPPFFHVLHCPWDLANSRPVHSLGLSSHLFLCLPCLLPPFTVPCKMVLARPDERETWQYHCSLRLFTIVRSSCGPIACWILARTSSLVTWSLYEMPTICGSTSFPWLVFFFGTLLWESMIHKHTGRWLWQGSTSVVSLNWEKCFCCFKLVSTLSSCYHLCYPGHHLTLGTLVSNSWA